MVSSPCGVSFHLAHLPDKDVGMVPAGDNQNFLIRRSLLIMDRQEPAPVSMAVLRRFFNT
jgi:hypothetical protein